MARRTIRMDMNFKGNWVRYTSLCMAASLFLRAVYYLGLTNFADIGFFETVFGALLPLFLSGAFIILLSRMRRNAPQLYGLIAAVFFGFAILACVFTGNIFRIILGAVWYAVAGGVLYQYSNGKLLNASLTTAVCVIPIVTRVILFDIGRLSLFGWILEASGLFLLAALACYPKIMQVKK